jgi:hypothetical protein
VVFSLQLNSFFVEIVGMTMLKLLSKRGSLGAYSGGLLLGALLLSSPLSAQTLPAVGDLLDVGLVLGGDMLGGTLLNDTLSLPGAGLVLGGDLLEGVGSVSTFELLGSLPGLSSSELSETAAAQ